MERWSGRVAVVTGASAGIGHVIARQLVLKGTKVVGLARRPHLIQELAAILKDAPGKLFAVKTDLSKEDDILSAFRWVRQNLGGVDVLVNNAGLFLQGKLSETKTSDWRSILEVNVLALSICTMEAIKSMKERGVNDGHIFHINSIAGHWLINMEGTAMLCATKHAVTTLTEGLRKELNALHSRIRITSISPGAVATEMLRNCTLAEPPPTLEPDDIADVILYTLATPNRVQIHEIIIRPNGETL